MRACRREGRRRAGGQEGLLRSPGNGEGPRGGGETPRRGRDRGLEIVLQPKRSRGTSPHGRSEAPSGGPLWGRSRPLLLLLGYIRGGGGAEGGGVGANRP